MVQKGRAGSSTEQECRALYGYRPRRVDVIALVFGFSQANTSTLERRDGKARGTDATSVRKSLTFVRTTEAKRVLGMWGVLVYNWARECRSLKRPLHPTAGGFSEAVLRVYARRSPAMAAGLTDQIWSIWELLPPTYLSEWAEIISRYGHPANPSLITDLVWSVGLADDQATLVSLAVAGALMTDAG